MKYRIIILSSTIIVIVLFLEWCSGGYSAKDKLAEAVYKYNSSIRWGRYDRAKKYVASNIITDHYKKLNRNLIKISEYDIIETQYNKDKDIALISIRIFWYSLKTGEAYTTILKQRWENRDGDWLLVEERVIDGKPL